jgi:hypothetical protein
VNPSVRLSEGDNYKGWTLDEIESKTTLFSRGDEITRLEISFDVAAPPQPRRTAQNSKSKARRAAKQGDGEEDLNADQEQPAGEEAEGTTQ